MVARKIAVAQRGLGAAMVQVIRRVGIAIGSFVAASLVIWLFGLVAGLFVSLGAFPFGPLGFGIALTGLPAFVLGALIYEDIMRRERPTAVNPGG